MTTPECSSNDIWAVILIGLVVICVVAGMAFEKWCDHREAVARIWAEQGKDSANDEN